MKNQSQTPEDSNPLQENLITTGNYKLYPMRFFIAALFCISSTNGVLIWLVWTPLQSLLVQDYSLSLTVINFCTLLIANLTFLPTSIYGNYILDEYGLRLGMLIGCTTTGIGLWIRCLCDHGFHWIFIGQLVASLGQPFFYNTPQKVSQVWFGPKERTIATAVITGIFTFSMAVGTVVPTLMMDLDTTDVNKSINELKNMMVKLAIAGTVCFLPVYFFFKNEPLTPPSHAAAAKKLPFKLALQSLKSNKNYVILMTGSSVIVASLVNAVSVMQPAIAPWGITSKDFSIFSAVGIVVGLIATVVVGYLVTKTQKYRIFLLGLCVLGAIFIPLTYLGAVSGSSFFWGVIFIAFVASQCPLIAVGLEFTLEVSFPVPEATSAGIIVVLGSILATGESLLIDWFLGKNPTQKDSSISFLVMTVIQVIGCIILLFVKEDLRRLKYEKEGFKNRNEQSEGTEAKDDLNTVSGTNSHTVSVIESDGL